MDMKQKKFMCAACRQFLSEKSEMLCDACLRRRSRDTAWRMLDHLTSGWGLQRMTDEDDDRWN
jgi:cytidine deaminase